MISGLPRSPQDLLVLRSGLDRFASRLSPRRSKRFVLKFAALIAVGLSVSCATPASAQTVYGSIFGTITDPQGAAVISAEVTITSVQKGTEFQTRTNDVGNYSVTHLIPDQYDIRAKSPGFKVLESLGVPVFADQAARIDMKLQVGGTRETMAVSAEAIPLLKTDRADIATTFGEREVGSLPILNRNFTSPGAFDSWHIGSGLATHFS